MERLKSPTGSTSFTLIFALEQLALAPAIRGNTPRGLGA
jgi:hypothetical protein